MGFWNNKRSPGSDMGTDILYTMVKGGCLIFIILGAILAGAIWLLS